MKLSTKARYGTRALLDIALHKDEGAVSLKDVSQRQKISLSYLEQLVTRLVVAGIVRTKKGVNGGVILSKDSKDIKLSEIVQALEGSLTPVECVDKPAVCERSETCVTRDVWNELKQAMNAVLESTTLQDLVERQHKKDVTKQGMYYI